MPDGTEHPQELLTKGNLWLASILEQGEGATPVAVRVYRMGAMLNQHRQTPRDMVVEFAEDTTKFQILEIARSKGHVPYKEHTILVFQDLPAAAIQIRSALKPVTQAIHEV